MTFSQAELRLLRWSDRVDGQRNMPTQKRRGGNPRIGLTPQQWIYVEQHRAQGQTIAVIAAALGIHWRRLGRELHRRAIEQKGGAE